MLVWCALEGGQGAPYNTVGASRAPDARPLARTVLFPGGRMKILHLNTHDIFGGAAIAAYRLHAGLRKIGQQSMMLVRERAGSDPDVDAFAPPAELSRRLLRYARRRNLRGSLASYRETRPADADFFSDDRTEDGAALIEQLPPCDVLHLHWVAGLIDYRSFFPRAARRAPIVWTLHDMNPFTGGCHYDHGCGKFQAACGACPQLGSSRPQDLSRSIWQRKRESYESVPRGRMQLVTPSRWLADQVQRSSLFGKFGVRVIPYGLDLEAFAPRERGHARSVLGLKQDAKVVLFVAHSMGDRRKGFALLAQALNQIQDMPGVHLLSMGRMTHLEKAGIPHVALGQVQSERLLSMVYSAADVVVVPSLQDNLPNTVLESLACGTPVIGCDVGGIPDAVREGVTGMLTPAGDAAALGRALLVMLENPGTRAAMAENCRRVAVAEYSLELQARRYLELYQSMQPVPGAGEAPA
jgi:glycosyltransferase involved in cell wall biosynthesis